MQAAAPSQSLSSASASAAAAAQAQSSRQPPRLSSVSAVPATSSRPAAAPPSIPTPTPATAASQAALPTPSTTTASAAQAKPARPSGQASAPSAPALSHDDERLLLAVRLLQIEYLGQQMHQAFARQQEQAEDSLKRVADHVMALQSEIADLQRQDVVRSQLVQTVERLEEQTEMTAEMHSAVAAFVDNYDRVAATLEASSRLVRLRQVAVPSNTAPLVDTLERAVVLSSDLVPPAMNLDKLVGLVEATRSEHDQVAQMLHDIEQGYAKANALSDETMIQLSRQVQRIELTREPKDVFE
ncbi:hypothetical protein BC831DRAFT_452273 [Entophlyctis helioformis]|nr:hypothetical protein BC831DRAFT_452273 [Entophlyctis helioformis]